jgi:membrane-bound ClpP family serine protease
MLAWVLSALFGAMPALAQQPSAAEPKAAPVVYVAPIEGTIDLGLAPFVQRVIDEATAAGAAAVVLDIDTFGGRVDAAVQIRDTLLDANIRTVAFVNKRAISAGALIALSAETIAMANGGTIGAAAPVQVGMPGGRRCRCRKRRCPTCARNSAPPPRRASGRRTWPRRWSMPTSRWRASSKRASC